MGAPGEISIHPDELNAQAPTFSTQSTNLASALAALKSSLAGLGSPWGADKQGQQFGAAYTPQHDSVIKAIGVLVQGLESIHDGLSTHAANHTDADAHNARTLQQRQ